MSDFYNPTSDPSADWTGSSKGYKASTAASDAISGLGDALKMGVAAVDNYYQGTIKEEAKTATDELFNASGNAGAVATEAGIKGKFTPTEIQRGYNQLSLLQQATKNGTLKESSFWAQSELISRQLKTRYPGYWEEIDSTMSSLVGKKPAIALQQELEQDRRASASKKDTERNNALHAARSIGLSEVFALEQSGKPISTDEINRMVASREAIKWTQESQARENNLKRDQNTFTEADALTAQRNDLQTELMTHLNDVQSPLFRSSADYKKFAIDIEAKRSSGQPIPPELEAAAVSAAATVTQLSNDLTNKYILKYAGDAPQSKMKDNTGFVSDWVKNYVTNVQQGDMNYTAINAAYVKSMQNHDDHKFMMSNDVLRKSASLTRIMGPQSELNWETRNGDSKILADRDIMIQKSMEDDMLLSGVSIVDQIPKMQAAGVRDPNAYSALVTRQMNAVTSPETPPVIKGNAIEALFGEKSLDFLDKAVPEAQRRPMYLKMSSPTVIKSIKKLHDDGQITSQDFQKFVDWSSRSGLNLIRDMSPEINNVMTSRKSMAVTYNPKTMQLDTTKTQFTPEAKTGVGRSVEVASENFLAGDAKRAVNEVNYLLKAMRPLIEATGEDPATTIPLILHKAGVDYGIVPNEAKGETGATPVVTAVEDWTIKFLEMALKPPESVDWDALKASYEKRKN